MDGIAKTTPKERADLFMAASDKRPRIPAGIMEKDFWVCWTLKRVFSSAYLPLRLIFKGGTSLSKVFDAISRFSEDVDISFDRRELGFEAARDPENATSGKKQKALLDALQGECEVVIRERLVPALLKDFETVIGAPGPVWGLEIDPDDKQTVFFKYPPGLVAQALVLPAGIKPSVRLELGARSDSWPARKCSIKSYAAELFPDMFQAASCEVNTLEAVRTFWEKATLLHAESHRTDPAAKSERLSRHFYDLYQLTKTGIAEDALKQPDLLKRVVAHKTVFFRSAWAHYETAIPGSFHLLPAKARMQALRNDYTAMQAMIFGDIPEWDEIMNGLQKLEQRLNQI
jgi:hypothetical protein